MITQIQSDPKSFLESIDCMSAEEANVQRLFGGERGMVSAQQQARALQAKDKQYPKKLAEAAKLVAAVVSGRKGSWLLQEALTASDFPLLFQDILDRMVLASYRSVPLTWNQYIKRTRVKDFRPVRRNAMSGADTVLDRVAELAPYPQAKLDEQEFTWSVSKFGRRMDLSWETIINDDMNQLSDIPDRFGKGAAETEELVATQIFADANGPKAAIFNNTNGNLIKAADGTPNAPLTFMNLQNALSMQTKFKDPSGRPIVITASILVVPPVLEFQAQNILAATQLELGTTAETQRLTVPNWLKGRVKIAVNWYLPYVITTGTRGDTSWFLFADPNVGRPAAEMGFLTGHEEPELFMKSPNAQRIGGGVVNPMDGDFDTDSIAYKIRHVTGGAAIDVLAMMGSNGTGS